MIKHDLTNQKFGILIVIKRIENNKRGCPAIVGRSLLILYIGNKKGPFRGLFCTYGVGLDTYLLMLIGDSNP